VPSTPNPDSDQSTDGLIKVSYLSDPANSGSIVVYSDEQHTTECSIDNYVSERFERGYVCAKNTEIHIKAIASDRYELVSLIIDDQEEEFRELDTHQTLGSKDMAIYVNFRPIPN
jgi:hypothetical protein